MTLLEGDTERAEQTMRGRCGGGCGLRMRRQEMWCIKCAHAANANGSSAVTTRVDPTLVWTEAELAERAAAKRRRKVER